MQISLYCYTNSRVLLVTSKLQRELGEFLPIDKLKLPHETEIALRLDILPSLMLLE